MKHRRLLCVALFICIFCALCTRFRVLLVYHLPAFRLCCRIDGQENCPHTKTFFYLQAINWIPQLGIETRHTQPQKNIKRGESNTFRVSVWNRIAKYVGRVSLIARFFGLSGQSRRGKISVFFLQRWPLFFSFSSTFLSPFLQNWKQKKNRTPQVALWVRPSFFFFSLSWFF